MSAPDGVELLLVMVLPSLVVGVLILWRDARERQRTRTGRRR